MRLRPIQTDEKGKRDHVLYRIPIHYIKGHTFLGRAAGMRLLPRHRRDEGNGANIPLLYRIPNGDYIKRQVFWGGLT